MDWVSIYGPVFGYFEGLNPVLFVAHPDTLQQILQTDFQQFVNRPIRDDPFSGSRGDVFNSYGMCVLCTAITDDKGPTNFFCYTVDLV